MYKTRVLNHARPANMRMTSKTNLVLVLLLMVTRASECLTSVTWEDEHQLVARVKILLLGELDLVMSCPPVLIVSPTQILDYLSLTWSPI